MICGDITLLYYRSTIFDGTMLFNASDVHTTNESSTQEWGQNLRASFASVPKNIDGVEVEPQPNYETLVNERKYLYKHWTDYF